MTKIIKIAEKEKTSNIKKLAKENLYNSTAQSIIKIFDTKYFLLKLILSLYLIMATGLSSLLVVQSTLTYLSFQVFTTTTEIFETPTEFPTVTICNRNPFTTAFSLSVLKSTNNNSSMEVDLFDKEVIKNLTYNEYSTLIGKLKQLTLGEVNNNKFSNSDRLKLAHSKEDIIVSCVFNGKDCKKDIQSNFEKRYGNCLVFNSRMKVGQQNEELKSSVFEGSDYGLKLTLYVNFYENLTTFNSLNALGVKVRIENISYLNDNFVNGIKVSPGQETDILIDRSFKFNLPKPYSPCEVDNYNPKRFDSFLYKLILNSPLVYSQQFCYLQCLQTILVDECNCTDPRVKSLLNSSDCDTYEKIKCKDKVSEEFLFEEKYYFADKCIPLCPLECNFTDFKATVSTNKIIGDLFLKYILEKKNLANDFLKRTLDAQTAAESFVKLNIFYKKMSYSLSIDTPKLDFVSFLAYIGGILGLFLGISVFSLFEIFIFLMEIYYTKKNGSVFMEATFSSRKHSIVALDTSRIRSLSFPNVLKQL